MASRESEHSMRTIAVIPLLALAACGTSPEPLPDATAHPTARQRSPFQKATISYLGVIANQSMNVAQTMARGESLSSIATSLRSAQAAEDLEYNVYLKAIQPIPIEFREMAQDTDRVHRSFAYSMAEMLAGAEGDGNEHIVNGSAKFKQSGELANTIMKQIISEP
jgi:hypothetical protein